MNLPVIIKFLFELIAITIFCLIFLKKINLNIFIFFLPYFLALSSLLAYNLGTSGISVQSWYLIIVGMISGLIIGLLTPLSLINMNIINILFAISQLIVAIGVILFTNYYLEKQETDFLRGIINEVSIALSIVCSAFSFTISIFNINLNKLNNILISFASVTGGFIVNSELIIVIGAIVLGIELNKLKLINILPKSKFSKILTIIALVSNFIFFLDFINGNSSTIWGLLITFPILGLIFAIKRRILP